MCGKKTRCAFLLAAISLEIGKSTSLLYLKEFQYVMSKYRNLLLPMMVYVILWHAKLSGTQDFKKEMEKNEQDTKHQSSRTRLQRGWILRWFPLICDSIPVIITESQNQLGNLAKSIWARTPFLRPGCSNSTQRQCIPGRGGSLKHLDDTCFIV